MFRPDSNPTVDSQSDPGQLGLSQAATLLFRGIRRRCPNCGHGPLFSNWVKMKETCPNCQLVLDRGEHDYFLGGYTINLMVAELLIVLGGTGTMVFTWPDVPWTLLTWALVFLMVLAPVLFYPSAKTLFLAVDLILRPLTPGDLAGPPGDSGSAPPGLGA